MYAFLLGQTDLTIQCLSLSGLTKAMFHRDSFDSIKFDWIRLDTIRFIRLVFLVWFAPLSWRTMTFEANEGGLDD